MVCKLWGLAALEHEIATSMHRRAFPRLGLEQAPDMADNPRIFTATDSSPTLASESDIFANVHGTQAH